MVAGAFNGSGTVSGLCRTLPFAEFKSAHQSVLGEGASDADDRLGYSSLRPHLLLNLNKATS